MDIVWAQSYLWLSIYYTKSGGSRNFGQRINKCTVHSIIISSYLLQSWHVLTFSEKNSKCFGLFSLSIASVLDKFAEKKFNEIKNGTVVS